MDEVICPHCGKKNTSVDRFCHQCLKPLRLSPSDKVNESQAGEEVPEWLKRIRELKRADEEREREKEKWRQQTLFGQNGDAKKGKDASTEKKNVTPQSTSERKQPSIKQPSPFHPPINIEQKNSTSSNQTAAHTNQDDGKSLPEGFLPLSIDED
jgi:hypothetical protein